MGKASVSGFNVNRFHKAEDLAGFFKAGSAVKGPHLRVDDSEATMSVN